MPKGGVIRVSYVIYVWPLMELSVSKFLVSVENDDSII